MRIARTRIARYGVAVAAVGLALLIEQLLDQLGGQNQYPFLPFFGAIIVSAFFGGLGPGLLATLLSTLVTYNIILPPTGSFLIQDEAQILRLGLFMIEGLAICGITALLTSTKRLSEKALRNLQESEERYRVVVETASDAVIIIDEDSQIEFVNGAAEKVFGYAAEEMLGESLTMLMPEPLREAHRAGLKRYIETGRRSLDWGSIELQGLRKNGEPVALEISFGEFSKDGKRCFTGFVRDITGRKRVERELRESEERFRLIAENARDLICILDEKGRYAYNSPSYESVLGYTAEELKGRPFVDLAHPEDVADLGDWQNAARFRFRARAADGAWVWLEGSSYELVWEGERYAIGISRDITESKRNEEEIQRLNEGLEQRVEERTSRLEQERTTLDAILNNLHEGVMAADAEERIIFANPAARSMLGLGEEESPGKLPDPWEDFDLAKAVSRCAQEGEGCIEVRVQTRGGLLQVNLEHLPEFDDGRGGTLVVMQDLSESWRLEARQQRFLANAAHELKTPITTILGSADFLLSEDGDDPERRRRFLNHILSEALRMRQLSETLLKLARTGVDQREPDLQPVVMGFLGEVAGRAEPLVEGAGLQLVLDDRGGCVLADPEWLEQALLILVSNAIKHSVRGGRLWLRVEGGTITVEDEGEGIREKDLPYLFERFYRGQSDSGGFGLGLPICKELVERMGGEISIESKRGSGTTVKIELPEENPE